MVYNAIIFIIKKGIVMDMGTINADQIHEFVSWVESSGAFNIEFFIDDLNMPIAKFNGSVLSYEEWYKLDNCSVVMH